MRCFRCHLRHGSLAAIVLMVLQIFALTVAAARQIESSLLHAQGKQIVICSIHGQMIVDWDGPAPQPSKQKPKGSCPFCLTGCNAFGTATPDAILVAFDGVSYSAGSIRVTHFADFAVRPVPVSERASSPRGPPVAIV